MKSHRVLLGLLLVAQASVAIPAWGLTALRKLEAVSFDVVNIEINGGVAASQIDAAAGDKACAAIGEALKAGAGAWGLKLFKSYHCGPARAGEPSWILRLKTQGGETVLSVFYGPAAGKSGAPPTRVLAVEGKPAVLSNPAVAAYVAAEAMASMPVIASVGAAEIRQGFGKEVAPAKSEIVAAPFTMQPDPRPGKLELVELLFDPAREAFSARRVGEANWQAVAGGGTWAARVEALSQAFVFAVAPDFKAKLNGAPQADDLWHGFLIGLRVGREIKRSQLFPPSIMYGVVVENSNVLGGGLRLFLDAIVPMKEEYEGERVELSWYRVTAGYGFGFGLPFLGLTAGVTPKLGIWSLKSRLPRRNSLGEFEVLPFEVNNGLGTGLELDVSGRVAEALLGRVWYEPGLAATQVAPGITSQRGGLDVRIPTMSRGSFRMNYLIFVTGERLTLAKAETSGAEDDATSAEVAITSSYVGGGVGLAW